MDTSPFSRRAFLALAGGTLLVACGGGGNDAEPTAGDGTSDLTFTEVNAGVMSSDLFMTSQPQRFAFAAIAKEGQTAGKRAQVAFAKPGSTSVSRSDLVPAAFHGEGLPDQRGVYTVDTVFDEVGAWPAIIEYDGEINQFAVQVNPQASTVVPGAAAIATPTPTTTAPLGTDPLCTLNPPCRLHERSLDAMLTSARPIALLFATPARCSSRYCGPVLESVLGVTPDYEPGIAFVHVEIYKNLTSNDRVAAVDKWGLPGEPWLFTIGADGKVRDRLDGAFDQSEIREVLDRLTA